MKPLRYLYVTSLALLLVGQALTSCQEDEHNPHQESGHYEKADVAISWYKLQLKIILNAEPAISPTVVSRILSYEGIGLYEAVRHEARNSVSLSKSLLDMPTMPAKENGNNYSWTICANAALAKMVRTLFPNLTPKNLASIDSLENVYNAGFKPNMQSSIFKKSQSFGNAIADAVIAWSKTDNDNQSNAGYVPPMFDGAWVPTPPPFAGPLAPYLGSARPFLKAHAQGLAPAVALSYSEDPSSAFYKMVRDVYDVSQSLTTDQRNMALFWNDVGIKRGYTPPGHAISILNQALVKKQSTLFFSAVAYAKIGIALRDATIVTWRSKYKYNLIRPVSYIRKVIDPNWLPLIGTPPHPEYPAAHALITGAAMETLTGLFGDHYAFTDNTYNFLGLPERSFSSFNDAATESGMSRRYGGIHYLPSIHVGLDMGRQVGVRVNAIRISSSNYF